MWSNYEQYYQTKTTTKLNTTDFIDDIAFPFSIILQKMVDRHPI